MYRFAAELWCIKDKAGIWYTKGTVVSELPHVRDLMSDVEYDIFNPLVKEDERIKVLDEGTYFIFITGEIFPESDTDWESGNTETTWLFTAEEKDVIFNLVSQKPLKVIIHDSTQKDKGTNP